MHPDQYSKTTAIVMVATARLGMQKAYPGSSERRYDDLVVGVVERMARLLGYELRPVRIRVDADE